MSSLYDPSSFSRVPVGEQFRFGHGGDAKGPAMCPLRSSLDIPFVTYFAWSFADI